MEGDNVASPRLLVVSKIAAIMAAFDIEYLWILGHRRPNASAAAHLSANIRRLVGPRGQ
jgi:hypothetical protein